MLKQIIYYGLILILVFFLAVPFVIQGLLRKILKKFNFRIKIAGFLRYHDISMEILKVNKIFDLTEIKIGQVYIRKNPQKFSFMIYVKDVNIKLGFRSLNFQTVRQFASPQSGPFTSEAEGNLRVINYQHLFNFIKTTYNNHETLLQKGKIDLSKKSSKVNMNSNREFFKLLFIRIINSLFKKLISVQVDNASLEIIEMTTSEIKPGQQIGNSVLKVHVERYSSEYSYLKNDNFLMENVFIGTSVYFKSQTEEKLDLITQIKDFSAKIFTPMTLRTENSIMKSTVEANFDGLDLNLKNEHLDTLAELTGIILLHYL